MNAALTACSNAPRKNGELSMLRACLSALGLKTEEAPNLSEPDFTPGRTPEKRAQVLMEFFSRDDLDLILDISGGDLANGILPYLDYKVIRASRACLWGYSDLTVLLNAFMPKPENPPSFFLSEALSGKTAACSRSGSLTVSVDPAVFSASVPSSAKALFWRARSSAEIPDAF